LITYYPLILMAMLLILSVRSYAQLSPGPLSQAHAHLEGMSNCTQCHDIGQKVPDSKCLSCHEEIDELINAGKGYHASREVRSQTCIDCHSDHHGRKFEMTRFNEEAFNHELTGYSLEGQHAVIDCRSCHTSDNIKDAEIRKREDTFLGLGAACLNCHNDYHQNTLGNDCASCHGMDAFRPAGKFDHNETEFVLLGVHTSVSCEDCHPIEMRNGNEFQQFSDVAFSDCVSCHTDPHGGLPGKCSACHTETEFQDKRYIARFSHGLTGFDLKGKHSSLSCFDCHSNNQSASQLFGDRAGIAENDCVRCHEDIHEGRFGTDCVRCHNESSFLSLNEGFEFNHDVTAFPLEGLHIEVDCNSCHIDSYRDPIAHATCVDCHDDYHNGQFVVEGQVRDCADCHSVYEGFSFTSFGFEEHSSTAFPLEGSHLATPCFACHLEEEDWQFADIGSRCVDCHEDIHEDHIGSDYYPGQDCSRCHNPELWAAVEFDHDLTSWPLEGAHENVSCRACHFEETQEGLTQEFEGLSTACYDCHENIHGDQFAVAGITACDRCHTTAGWGSEGFDHSHTDFPLEGRHAELECSACHDIYEDGMRVFTIEKFECIDCHS